ncbi:diguanylate cyclase (GGDEF) domain-containing protein [Papillibacter cinnamivorans DSM 12816]|uniref:Diguanylate cyclase (GGDEF) domain-containing protein n=2 Tax=Papillibacter TaxID=100175 RepID=A0A1W1ZLN1_9FIRM|nr:diguanylate cyclase (GGDEF) domain-containing protein [Papillibacter cinnamivorans DSM 12816]
MQNDSPILQNSTPFKMLIACFLSCVVGVVLMAATSNFLLMGVFIGILLCIVVAARLFSAGKISIETACLAPMLLLCFAYTPLSWFAYNGLLGCTPYLSILFIAVIVLTYYSKIQLFMLSLYTALLLGLTVHWFVTWPGEKDTNQIVNILVAYVLTASVIVFLVEGIKRKNREINRRMTDLSMRDDLTGLLNRRSIQQVLDRMERIFIKEGSEYGIVMMDIDHFKSINDLYGHNWGDSALKSLAACILKSIRSLDYAFRFGGDEFLLILPDVDRETLWQICARIEEASRGMHGFDFPVAMSTGCALRSESSDSAAVLELADSRMYAAKESQSK